MKNIKRLRDFVQEFTRFIDQVNQEETKIFEDGKNMLVELVSHDDWLPDECAQLNPKRYQQYLLYCDPMERFSMVSFVWGPGHNTPVHDHTVWGMVGILRGLESCQEFSRDDQSGVIQEGKTHLVHPGEVDLISPRIGDIHRVANGLDNETSVSIHMYGANIGAVHRHIYELTTHTEKSFISGYSNDFIPNLWNRSAE